MRNRKGFLGKAAEKSGSLAGLTKEKKKLLENLWLNEWPLVSKEEGGAITNKV